MNDETWNENKGKEKGKEKIEHIFVWVANWDRKICEKAQQNSP